MSDDKDQSLHSSVSGGFNQHTPPYWRLMIPALMARYIPRWANSIRGLQDAKRNAVYDIAAGTWAMGVTAYFAMRTGQDIKNVFAESVAYELDKKPTDVTVSDLAHSDNKALRKARKNFIFYNSLRAAINSSFFASFVPGGPWHGKDSVDLGVGLNGGYLLSEVMLRDSTFFEQVQNFIDRKVNQDNSLGEDINPIELTRLYERNALDNDRDNAFKGRTDTQMWKQSQVIFRRMADLMNHSYQPTETRKDNFKLPKFLYLVGHNLIQPKNVEQTLAYIEVANKYGMSALKDLVREIDDGVNLQSAMQRYPLDISLAQAASIEEKNPNKLFAKGLEPRSLNVPEPAATKLGQLAQQEAAPAGRSL